MLACTRCRAQLLDHLYGLLDPAAEETVAAHLAGCPACIAELERTRKMQGLFAAAAKSAFPGVSFAPPGRKNAVAEPVRRGGPTDAAARGRWVKWIVAATLLVATVGVGIPAVVNTVGYAVHRPKVDAEQAKLDGIQSERRRLESAIRERKETADRTLADAKSRHEELERQWISAEAATVKRLADKPFLVELSGPASAVAGAPNEYSIHLTNADGTPLTSPVTVEAKVKDSSGSELYADTFTTNPQVGAHQFKLPSGAWSKVSADSEVFLHITATDRAGARSDLVESLRLLEPVYTTFLTTDKPMYRPGEIVYFRSLTLDRTRFLPPAQDQTLRFEFKAPSGEVLAGSEQFGVARLGTLGPAGDLKPVLGPDGQPIRGVGCGAFTLPDGLAGGEYTLNVFEVPSPSGPPKPGAGKPLAVRKFLVNEYRPEQLLKKLEFDGKSYGPGDVVQAKFDLKDQGQPLGGATITVTAQANGQDITLDVAPKLTDANGVANLRFTLPKVEAIRSASVSVGVTAKGISETLVRQVPLATRKLSLEFFPEGGDLILGVPNRVYFRATTSFGKPADVSGTLTDGVATITALKTLTDPDQPGANQGLGVFEFTPQAGKRYTVRLDKPVGVVQPAGGDPLPAAKDNGVVLSVPTGVTKAGESIRLTLHTVGAKRTVLVGAYIRGRSVAHQKVTLEPGRATNAELNPGDTKLGGVTRITVFDLPNDDAIGREDLTPLAERLVFRTPGEELKLSYTARKAGGAKPTGAFVPGARVDLDVFAKDEVGAAKPAILWTAVVNQSVVTMADEKTERTLPTHFLLSGEVKKGEELEHADFLLTAHPKAAEALDLLLGTQGWRRFAEQAPAEFRRKNPADDADRLRLVSADAGPIPTGWRPAIRRVFDEYWPKYESALASVETAERGKAVAFAGGNDERMLSQANDDYQKQLAVFGATAAELDGYDTAWERWRAYLPYLMAVLGGMALMAIVIRTGAFRTGQPGRRPLAVAAVTLLALMGAVGLMALLTGRDNGRWRDVYALAPKPTKMAAAAPDEQMAVGGAMRGRDRGMVPFDLNGANRAVPKDAMRAEGMPEAAMMRPRAMDPTGPGGLPPPPGGNGGGGMRAMRAGAPAVPAPAAIAAADAGRPEPLQMKMLPDKKDTQADRKMGHENDQARLGPAKPGPGSAANPGVAPRRGQPGGFGLPGGGGGRGPRLGEQKPAGEMFMMAGGLVAPPVQESFNRYLARRNAELAKAVNESVAKGDAVEKIQRLVPVQQFLPQAQPLPVREYAHTRPELSDDAPRTDFTETLLWHPAIVTPTDGKATVTFSLSDEVAPYRVLVAGHTLDGRIGAVTGTIEVRKPFSLDPKLPQEISSSDKLSVPVVGLNATDASRKAEVSVSTVGLKVEGEDRFLIDLPPNSGGRKIVPLTPDRAEGELTVQLEGKSGGDRDTVLRTLRVVPDGFPMAVSKSDVLEQKVSQSFRLPEQVVPGTLKLTVSVYPNTLSEVQAGLEGMLREPYGCFEQTSTTNYPNVLILDYLNETNQAKPDVSRRAKDLLDRGYGRLISFECQKPQAGKEGYEWFGGTAPPHEALTAYGLLQFTDMARVHPVDAEMLRRTKEYLLSTRDGQGGFRKNPRALDSFGYAPAHITNAYIVWAISESERNAAAKSDLDKEVAALLAGAKNGDTAKDPYYLGLVANALLNRGMRKDAEPLLAAIVKMQKDDGQVPGAKTTITNSVGEALLIETTGMAVLGWLKANDTGAYRVNVDKASRWIGSKRGGYGGFGSTQSTILALKALIEFARSNKRPAENGTVRVMANGVEVGKVAFTTEQAGPIVVTVPDAEKRFNDGGAEITVETDAKQAYPCTLALECRSRKPDSSTDCPIKLGTRLSKADAAEGDTVRLSVRVENLKEKQNGMVTAIVGIPAGLKLPEDMKQLKKLTERPDDGKRPTVSYWEKRGREVIFYWHGLNEREAVTFDLDLIAETPGSSVGPASRVYLYYGAEHKHWVDPLKVTVTAK
jgi:hypothetical protein